MTHAVLFAPKPNLDFIQSFSHGAIFSAKDSADLYIPFWIKDSRRKL
jgi:hypothetical protein